MTVHEIQRQQADLSLVRFDGRVLDIGGGGEGIIAQHSRDQVVAIDRSRAELEEAPDAGLKIVMDASELAFLDCSFENVTCFYSLMYMDAGTVRRVLREAARVLKPGGVLWIWDVEMPAEATAEVFLMRLDVRVSSRLTVDTGYGVLWQRGQTLDGLRQIGEQAGLACATAEMNRESFFLTLRKPGLTPDTGK